MRKQAGSFEDEFTYGGEVIERTRIALNAEEFAGFGKNPFGLIAEAEEGFLATGLTASFGEGEDFLRSHEMRAGLTGVFAEGAVAAIVAAKSGERDENLFRESDDCSLALGAQFGCGGEEVSEGSLRGLMEGFFAGWGME